MALWEYKVITSGKGGFATPAMLEKFINDLGKEEWEIIEFRTSPDNALAFSGLARRPTQRDWTLEDAAAAAARTEADKLRAEFAAKFQAATGGGTAESGAEKHEPAGEGPHQDDTFRRPRDTERDLDPTASDDEAGDGGLDLPEEEELPTFFEAIRPHMRRNQRGPGLSVSLEYLVKKFDMLEGDLVGALKECGLTIPKAENEAPGYVEFDGDLYWVNLNRQRQLFINTREKPRPVFRIVPAARIAPPEDEKPEPAPAESAPPEPAPEHEPKPKPENRRAPAEPQTPATPAAPAVPLPGGSELLDKLRPLMRRNRGGGSGSLSFLSRALKQREPDLAAALAAIGLTLPANGGEKPPQIEVGGLVYWLNRDNRGGVWINAREKRDDEPAPAPAGGPAAVTAEASAPPTGSAVAPLAEPPSAEAQPAAVVASGSAESVSSGVLAAVRLLLKETKTGSFSAKVERLADELNKPAEDFLSTLTGTGLTVPDKAREKPVFVEHAGEVFWLNKNAKEELWLNAKASKFAGKDDGSEDGGADKKPRRGRSKKKPDAAE